MLSTKKLILHEERLLRNVNQAEVVKNIQGIKHYCDVLYAVKDLNKTKITKSKNSKATLGNKLPKFIALL